MYVLRSSILNTVSTRYVNVEVHTKLLIYQNKFSSLKKLTFEIAVVYDNGSGNTNHNRKFFHTIIFDIGGYFEISVFDVFEISRVDCIVVDLLFYVHGKHLRSCRDGQLT